MTRAADIASRLPELYRDGPEVRRWLAAVGLQLAMGDEAMREVQRAHFFDRALDLDEVAALAALLDIAPEEWQGLREYRAYVHGLRDAILQAGAVTRHGIGLFTRRYVTGFQQAHAARIVARPAELAAAADPDRLALIENPMVPRFHAEPQGLEALARVVLENRGLDPTRAALVITGLADGGPVYAPALANITTGQALIWHGVIPPGQRLWIEPASAGGVRALLEGVDRTADLVGVEALEPGDAASLVPVAPRPLELARGANDLWFQPLAHYGVPGLDHVLLALAELNLKLGRWDETAFDRSLFYMEPTGRIQFAWAEAAPATMTLAVPAGRIVHPPDGVAAAEAALAALQDGLSRGLDRLAAAGIRATVAPYRHRDRLATRDRLAGMLPMRLREAGSMGADSMPSGDGRFGVSDFNDSVFD
jgi:hypothetical protein